VSEVCQTIRRSYIWRQQRALQPPEPMSHPLPARQLTVQLTCRHGGPPCTASSSQPRAAVFPSCAGRPAPGRRADSLRVSAARQGQGYTRYSDSYVLVDPNPGYVPEVQAEQQRLGWVQNLLTRATGLLLRHAFRGDSAPSSAAGPQQPDNGRRPLPVRAWLALGLVVAAVAWAIRRVFASSPAVEHETYRSPTEVRHRVMLHRRLLSALQRTLLSCNSAQLSTAQHLHCGCRPAP